MQGSPLFETVWHELRHAQQAFLVARLVAGWGGAEAVNLWVTDNAEVVQRAVDNPLRYGALEYQAAVYWFDSEYGPGRAQTRATTRSPQSGGRGVPEPVE